MQVIGGKMSLFAGGLTQWETKQYLHFAQEAEQEIVNLAAQWGVIPERAYELVDLYKAHTPYVWQQCVNQLKALDYQGAQEMVSLVCSS